MQLHRVNPTVEKQGIWKEYDGTEFLIARAGKDFLSLFERLSKPHKDKKGNIKYSAALLVTAEALSECVLLDWKGMKDGDKDVPFSKSEARALLERDDEFRQFVTDVAGEAEAFYQREKAELGKESKTPTDG